MWDIKVLCNILYILPVKLVFTQNTGKLLLNETKKPGSVSYESLIGHLAYAQYRSGDNYF
jgi:hypothetical protein